MENAPGTVSRYTVTVLAVTAVAAANALLWTMRPTAEPVTPDVMVESAPGERPAEVVERSFDPIPMDPREPLDLELELDPPFRDNLGRGSVLASLHEQPYLDLKPREPARAGLESDTRATAGVEPAAAPTLRGYRLSNNLRLRGGIGFVDHSGTRDRDYAIGIGLDLTY